jgi:hypothetical protein
LDPKSAITAFENLNKRFPESDFLLTSYFNLYQLNVEINNKKRAEYYKDLIVSKFPNSKYAQMLTNPNYAAELQATLNKVNSLYEETYNYFRKQDYNKVIDNYTLASTDYKNNYLMPKFHLLKAMAIGKTSDVNTFKTALNEVITAYPGTEVKKSAEDILAHIKSGDYLKRNAELAKSDGVEPEIKSNNNVVDTSGISIYKYNEKSPHLYIVLVENKKTDVNELKFNISDFNTDFFSSTTLNVASILLDNNSHLITVKTLDDKKMGMKYFKAISTNQNVFKNLKQTEYRHFIISDENFVIFYKDKDVGKYLNFFKKNYQNN